MSKFTSPFDNVVQYYCDKCKKGIKYQEVRNPILNIRGCSKIVTLCPNCYTQYEEKFIEMCSEFMDSEEE